MNTTTGDSHVAQFEDALKQVTIASWNRVRSSDELASFINRRHSELAEVEL